MMLTMFVLFQFYRDTLDTNEEATKEGQSPSPEEKMDAEDSEVKEGENNRAPDADVDMGDSPDDPGRYNNPLSLHNSPPCQCSNPLVANSV